MNDRGIGVRTPAGGAYPPSYYFFCEVVILVFVGTISQTTACGGASGGVMVKALRN